MTQPPGSPGSQPRSDVAAFDVGSIPTDRADRDDSTILSGPPSSIGGHHSASPNEPTSVSHRRRESAGDEVSTAPGSSGGGGQQVFGPNMSALAMLKQLRFSPFVAARLRGEAEEAAAGGGRGTAAGVEDRNHIGGGGLRRNVASAWEYFSPQMLEVYYFISYVICFLFFCASIACIVYRYKSKPDTPITCDYRLDQALSWLAGLQMPAAILIPFWMAIFNQHVYPPLHANSRIPIERTFNFYTHFVMFSTFMALLMVGIFGSCLYALSVAKSWNLVEHEACGGAFNAVRGISISVVVAVGLCVSAHFVLWAWLNSKLDEQRGIVRPIPMPN